MEKLILKNVTQYVEKNIGVFHQKRIERINKLKLKQVLRRKNPYLFRAKHYLTAEAIVRSLTDAFISSNEETLFGDWLEGLVLFINNSVYNGKKSSADGIDLEFEKDGNWHIVTIKSGPNWGNRSQKQKMLSDFADAKRRLSSSGNRSNVICVNGCCYGKDKKPHKFPAKGIDYFKLCGQQFWEFISGDAELYKEIIYPLGTLAKERNEDFEESYSKIINRFSMEFMTDFCDKTGAIDWIKLVRFNSENANLN